MSTPQGAGRFGGNSNPQSPAPSPGAEGSNVFTRKLGPLPLWAWMGIGLAIALGIYFWKQNGAKAKASATGQSITPPGTSPDQTTSASQIPQFVNLTNVQNSQSQNTTKNVTPPAQPAQPPPATTSQVPAWVATLKGMSLAQAVQTIQQNGWVVNSTSLEGKSGVRFAQNIAFNNPSYSGFSVVGAGGYVNGVGGHNFANSVDLTVNDPGTTS